MAKLNRISKKETASARNDSAGDVVVTADQQTGSQFVGQWNRLVSTTNWEKGRIICDWREALMTDGEAVTEYSDEAWAQLVGGVTSQHVGRLRRVFQRFGEALDQYQGLYWSHFQAAMDWDDAEMWLEGSLQNDWSVSQMRGQRWETLGTPPEEQQAEAQAVPIDLDEQFPEVESPSQESADDETTASKKTIQPVGDDSKESAAKKTTQDSADSEKSSDEPSEVGTQVAANKRQRLDVSVEELPDDLADAFEQFKLAIIAHRREGWQETSPEAVVECLDALRILALAEND